MVTAHGFIEVNPIFRYSFRMGLFFNTLFMLAAQQCACLYYYLYSHIIVGSTTVCWFISLFTLTLWKLFSIVVMWHEWAWGNSLSLLFLRLSLSFNDFICCIDHLCVVLTII